ncbi:MAG: hypothetical protein HYR91_08745 [Flavobacteriia bacterium]|nr:hypothetical protein [Flavobacteriia bacterium]
MNGAHFHLVVNHLPIIIPMAALIVLIVGFIVKSEAVKRTSYFLFLISAICTIPAFTSGEGAEELAESLPEVTDHLIHEHEEKAESFALFSYALGVLSLISLWASWKKQQFAKWLSYFILLLALVVIIKGREVGTTGGEVRHTEIRKGFVSLEQEEVE